MHQVFFIPGNTAAIDYAKLREDGEWITLHTAQTIDELQATYPGIILGTECDFTAQMEEACRTEPEHITAGEYQDAFKVLPPVGWRQSAETESFKLMEHYSGRITNVYARVGKQFYRFLDLCTLEHSEIIAKVRNSAQAAMPSPTGTICRDSSLAVQ